MLSAWRSRRPVVPALAGLALAVTLGACSAGGGGYRVTAFFPRAVSLYEHSSVKVLGLSAGKVDHVRLVGGTVRVDMTIDKDVKLPVGVGATIIPLSLIGERYVQLFPPWVDGQAAAPAGTVIPVERTTVPTEPDEALAALKKFLDTLDPNATGRLVKNLSADLDGNGQSLNGALKGLGELSTTLAAKDQQLIDIVDHFDRLTATLRTRESQLGQVMDEFAVTTKLLADERRNIGSLVHSLATLSTSGLDLVSTHGARLEKDITQLTTTLQAVGVHLDNLDQILIATPLLAAGPQFDGKKGLAAAVDPTLHRIDLRNEVSPSVSQAFGSLGLPVPGGVVCLPIDVSCTPSGPAGPIVPPPPALSSPAAAAAATGSPAAVVPIDQPGPPAVGPGTPTTPIDGIVRLLGTVGTPDLAGTGAAAAAHARPATGPFSWLRRLARAVTGAAG